MPEYGFTPKGKVYYSRYSKKGVPRLGVIFPESPENAAKFMKTKKSFKGRIHHHYGMRTHSSLIRQIFYVVLETIMNKVADGHVFMLPSTTEAHILLKATPDDEVRALRQNGYFKDFDIVKAGFKIPRFVFDFGPYDTKIKDMQIYLPAYIRDKALRNAEEGKIPYTTIPKRRKVYDSSLERHNG